ncbi:MAG: hypothetical protein ACREPY_14150 [Rhodanobacteraceae bacterium]
MRVPGGEQRGQIKTRQRVRDLAEVYTHEREVKAMLDLVPDMFPAGSIKSVDMKFLEPACGSGNFLEEILRRKLAGIRFGKVKSIARYEHWLLRALASIYGVDISEDNVGESRVRLLEVLRSHYSNDANTVAPSQGFVAAARMVAASNIIHADFLADAATVEVIDYQPMRGGLFLRVWSMLDDSVEPEPIRDLFHPEPAPKRDEVPVHYAELAAHPEPTRTLMGEPAQ